MQKPKPTIFVLDPYHEHAIELLVKQGDSINVVFREDERAGSWRDEADAVMIRSETRITRADLAEAGKLKVIVKQGVGVDNVDLDAAKERNIAVCNTPAMNAEAVAELTITLALCLARRVVEMDRKLLRGERLVRSQLMGQSLFQKTIGIIGMGNIGKEVARKWTAAMQGHLIAYDPFAPEGAWSDVPHHRVTGLDDLLRGSDVISLHVPLTNGTRGLIGEKAFGIVKRNAILVNCARGGIVDEAALLQALTSKRIFGAALDATEVEPPKLESHRELLAQDNVVITPHVGATTDDNQSASGRKVVETVLAVLQGKEVPNRVA